MRPEKTLGVLGGMGPAATADFLRVLAERTPAGTDQEHPRMIVYSHTITPDRTTFLLGKGDLRRIQRRLLFSQLLCFGLQQIIILINTQTNGHDEHQQQRRHHVGIADPACAAAR